MFRAIDATPDHEAFYLSRAPETIRRHTATPLMSLRRGGREAFLHTGAWDDFWLGGAVASYLERTIRTSCILPCDWPRGSRPVTLGAPRTARARLVVTFHEYLAICANHGQMAGIRFARGLRPCSAPLASARPGRLLRPRAAPATALLLADAYVSPSHFLVDRYVAWGLPLDRFRTIENDVYGSPVVPRALSASGRRDRFAFLVR